MFLGLIRGKSKEVEQYHLVKTICPPESETEAGVSFRLSVRPPLAGSIYAPPSHRSRAGYARPALLDLQSGPESPSAAQRWSPLVALTWPSGLYRLPLAER